MKRTLAALAAGALILTGCSSTEDGTAEATDIPAGFECETLTPWFDVVRSLSEGMGEPYDPDQAAEQVQSWVEDPAQAERDLGGLGSVDVDESWNWDALTDDERAAATEQIQRAADGAC